MTKPPTQIIFPHDEGISSSILSHLASSTWSTTVLGTSPFCTSRTAEMKHAYFASFDVLWTPLAFVNMSMRGTSDPFVREAFYRFGFKPFTPVVDAPDSEFPTVMFLNPEEAGT